MATPRLQIEDKELCVADQFLVDAAGTIWDWRDLKGNWVHRAILERKYARFILTHHVAYWRPAFDRFNQLFYQDFVQRKQYPTQHILYFEKVRISLFQALHCFAEELYENHHPFYTVYYQLKYNPHVSLEWLDTVLQQFLNCKNSSLALINQFYGKFTFTPYGWEHIKHLMPAISDREGAVLYEEAQPVKLFGPHADPNLRGRIKCDASEITDRRGRIGYLFYDGYTMIKAPHRKYAHFSASSFYKLIPETESVYVREMHNRGFNVNAGPSGTMGRMQLLLKIFRCHDCLSEDETRQITLAIAADFVRRGHHTWIEAMQACQANPLQNHKSCFDLFLLPEHLLVRNPRLVYETFFLAVFSNNAPSL